MSGNDFETSLKGNMSSCFSKKLRSKSQRVFSSAKNIYNSSKKKLCKITLLMFGKILKNATFESSETATLKEVRGTKNVPHKRSDELCSQASCA